MVHIIKVYLSPNFRNSLLKQLEMSLLSDDRMSNNLTGVYLLNLVCVRTKDFSFNATSINSYIISLDIWSI